MSRPSFARCLRSERDREAVPGEGGGLGCIVVVTAAGLRCVVPHSCGSICRGGEICGDQRRNNVFNCSVVVVHFVGAVAVASGDGRNSLL